MKCTIPEISWHNRDPVLSLDVQPSKTSDSLYRLATGGTDSHVLIWLMSVEKGGVASLECAADLTRHTKPVNCVRFSPNGELLATGDDESCIIIWKMKTSSDPVEFPTGEEETFKEQWKTVKVLRGHLQDVYDLSWSADSKNLISGSVDNSAIMWEVLTGKNLGILSEHKGFVQGVAWDPCNQFVATISSDRVCRVYNSSGSSQRRAIHKLYKGHLPGVQAEKPSHYFHDDTLKSFFRRLSFTPDGELLIVPSGIVEEPGKSPVNCTIIFSRKCLSKPAAFLPSLKQYTVAVRCCPVLFTLRTMDSPPLFDLPYRVVMAVATQCSVILYDTQHAAPFAFITKIHYTRLTDLSWSSDGRVLVVSSTDGYCSVITFAENELGTVYNSENNKTEESKPKEAKANDIVKNGSSEKTNIKKSDEVKSDIIKNGDSKTIVSEDNKSIVKEKTLAVNLENPEKPSEVEVINLTEDSMDVSEEKDEKKDGSKGSKLQSSQENKGTPMDVDDDFQLVYEGTITEPVLEAKTEQNKTEAKSEESTKIENKAEKKGELAEKTDVNPKSNQSPNKSSEAGSHLQREAFSSPRNTGNITPGSNKKTPRRVQLITLSSPKSKKKLLE